MRLELPSEPREVAPGAWHASGWLNAEAQLRAAQACTAWLDGPTPAVRPKMPNGSTMSVRMACLGWHWQPYRYSRTTANGLPVAELPVWLADLAQLAARETLGENEFEPDVALINAYANDSKMGMHQDKDEVSLAPVVSLSLGNTCNFRFGNTNGRTRPYTDIELLSGDLFVFGGSARLAFHGVTKVFANTGPPELGIGNERVNITVRQTGL